MSRWFTLVLLAALAVAAGLLASRPWGNVLILVPPWRIEIGVGLAVLAVLLAFAVLYGTLRLVAWFSGLSGRVRGWQRERSRQQRREASQAARLDQLQGRHARAAREFAALASASREDGARAAVIEQLSALRSWQALAQSEAVESGLVRARELANGDHQLIVAIQLVEAEWRMQQGDARGALLLLDSLHAQGPRHAGSLRLALQAHREQGDAAEVLRLARLLGKNQALNPVLARQIVVEAASRLCLSAATPAELASLWRSLRTDEQRHPMVAAAAAQAWQQMGDGEQARVVLTPVLEQASDSPALEVWADAPVAEVAQRLALAETWVRQRPLDASLKLMQAALCLRGQLWGQARRYLDEAATLGEQGARYAALRACLAEQQNDLTAAAQLWRQAALAGLDRFQDPRPEPAPIILAELSTNPPRDLS